MIPADEELAARFYDWEKRGRGWEVCGYPVELEPRFRPFFGHYLVSKPVTDDARTPGFFETLIDNFRGRKTRVEPPRLVDEEEFGPAPFSYLDPLVELGTLMPAETKLSPEQAIQFLDALANGYDPVSFELIGTSNSISLQFVVAKRDQATASEQIKGYFPRTILRERSGFLDAAWRAAGDATAMVDFALSREFMLPLRTGTRFDVDPFIPLIAGLTQIAAGELGVFQVLFTRARHPWADSIMRAVQDGEGGAFFVDSPEFVALAREKVAHPLVAAVVRVAGRAKTARRAWEIARNAGGSLSQFSDPTANEFMPLTNDRYPDDLHSTDFLGRTSRRSGMLLNTQELASLVHVPSSSVQSAKFRRSDEGAGFSGITDEFRSRHVYIAGATQHGKSTLIERMALADIKNGHGLCILDPKGDLIKSIIDKVPERRADDTILLEASNPVPIDFMGWETEQERQTLAADVFQTFLQFSTMTAGDQWLSVLRAVIYTLLDAKNCSFLDINAILVNDEKRREILARVTNPDILDYWALEFPQLKKDAPQPIITRMKQFTFTPPLKTLLGTADARLNIFDCMENRKILLVDLTGVGKSNGNLIGQLLVSKIQQGAFRRESQARNRRIPFYLYADEFQNFQTSAFDTILSEAGGYRLCLTLANQGLYQLEPKIKDAIFTNVTGGWIVFHIDEKDVPNFKLKTQPLDAEQLASLPPHTAFIKTGRPILPL